MERLTSIHIEEEKCACSCNPHCGCICHKNLLSEQKKRMVGKLEGMKINEQISGYNKVVDDAIQEILK